MGDLSVYFFISSNNFDFIFVFQVRRYAYTTVNDSGVASGEIVWAIKRQCTKHCDEGKKLNAAFYFKKDVFNLV